MMKIKLIFLGLVVTSKIFAQSDVIFDFDNDGHIDSLTAIRSDTGFVISCYLSSLNNKVISSNIITNRGDIITATLENKVVVIRNQFMRAESIFRFRYAANLKQLILIGYDTENYGNAMHDGSGQSSYNLLTGLYKANWNRFSEKKMDLVAVPTIVKKFPVKIYTLQTFSDKVIEELDNKGYQLLPKSMQ
jgi:hypothetical protein